MVFLRCGAWAVAALAFAGCGSAAISAPHQPYTALLDHAGQLDVSARGGVMSTNAMTAAVQAAYAPIDNLEVAASFDADLVDENPDRTLHVGGGAAIGTFVRDDVLRAELLVGGNGGYAEGGGSNCLDRCLTSETLRLTGPYGQAFVQGAIGFEVPYFEFAGGFRFFSNSVLAHAVGNLGTDATSWSSRGFAEPYITMRIPIDWFRIELLAGWPFSITGDSQVVTGAFEPSSYPYVTLGIGFQLDTMTSPIAQGAYVAPATP